MSKHKELIRKIINGALFYLGWGWCLKDAVTVSFPIEGPLIIATILFFHMLFVPNMKAEFWIILMMTIFGTVIDTLSQVFGLIHYKGGYPNIPWLAPLWITSLWALYATSLSGSMSWLLQSRPLAVLFGLFGGPFSYMVAIRVGAADILVSERLYLAIIGIAWAFILPGSLYFAQQLRLATPPQKNAEP